MRNNNISIAYESSMCIVNNCMYLPMSENMQTKDNNSSRTSTIGLMLWKIWRSTLCKTRIATKSYAEKEHLPSYTIHEVIVNEEEGSQCSCYSKMVLLASQDSNSFYKHHSQDYGLKNVNCSWLFGRGHNTNLQWRGSNYGWWIVSV